MIFFTKTFKEKRTNYKKKNCFLTFSRKTFLWFNFHIAKNNENFEFFFLLFNFVVLVDLYTQFFNHNISLIFFIFFIFFFIFFFFIFYSIWKWLICLVAFVINFF